MRKLFIVSHERFPDQVLVQKVDLDERKYLMPRYFKEGDIYSWASTVADMIQNEHPYDVIYDEYGLGKVFKDLVEKILGDDYSRHKQMMDDALYYQRKEQEQMGLHKPDLWI